MLPYNDMLTMLPYADLQIQKDYFAFCFNINHFLIGHHIQGKVFFFAILGQSPLKKSKGQNNLS